jgi:hypothetical protein
MGDTVNNKIDLAVLLERWHNDLSIVLGQIEDINSGPINFGPSIPGKLSQMDKEIRAILAAENKPRTIECDKSAMGIQTSICDTQKSCKIDTDPWVYDDEVCLASMLRERDEQIEKLTNVLDRWREESLAYNHISNQQASKIRALMQEIEDLKTLERRSDGASGRLVNKVMAGTCLFAGEGRGDCEHFVGLPDFRNITDANHAEFVDEYGKPLGWCWVCWLKHQNEQMGIKMRRAISLLIGIRNYFIDRDKMECSTSSPQIRKEIEIFLAENAREI